MQAHSLCINRYIWMDNKEKGFLTGRSVLAVRKDWQKPFDKDRR